jgi:hypothetical protein
MKAFFLSMALLAVCLCVFPHPKFYTESNHELIVNRCNLHLIVQDDIDFDTQYYYKKMLKREFINDGI